MRRSLLLPPLAVLLVLLAAAPASRRLGHRGLSSTPAGVEPGKPWNVDITVLQHGRRPWKASRRSVRSTPAA